MNDIEIMQEPKPIVRSRAASFSYDDGAIVSLQLFPGGEEIKVLVGSKCMDISIEHAEALYEALVSTHNAWRKKASWEI